MYNPIKGTEFEELLETWWRSENEEKGICSKSLVRLIGKGKKSPNPITSANCPALTDIFNEKKFEFAEMAARVRSQLPAQIARLEKHFGKTLTAENMMEFFHLIDEHLAFNYEPSPDQCKLDLYNDMLLVSTSILAHDLDRSDSDGYSMAYRYLSWQPILQTLANLDTAVREENPVTLKYLFVGLHDVNLAHLLSSLGYYHDLASEQSSHLPGIDFNSSIRFEVWEKEMYADESLDE